MSVLSALTCLGLRRPDLAATPSQVASFYDELASLHDRLAAEAVARGEHDRELRLAAVARRHVREVIR